MQPNHLARAEDNRVRFVFDDAVVSFRLPASATFEDVARTWGEFTPQHHGNPIAIVVTMAASYTRLPLRCTPPLGPDKRQ